MIVVTRLNGTRFAVNPDLIERIHESPDTHLVTLDGAAYVVLESLAEVVELIADYRAYILSKARDFPAITGYPLSLVRTDTSDDDTDTDNDSDDDTVGAGPTAPVQPRK
jgi:flagellar protein FlbD